MPAPLMIDKPELSLVTMQDDEFGLFRDLVERVIGIHLSPIKKTMLSGRLAKRLRDLGLVSYGDYFRLITNGSNTEERQLAIDLITTNETYFFREPKHFDALRDRILPTFHNQPVRVWSAACSSGEEPYSIAMTMADVLGDKQQWEVVGSDISRRVLQAGQRGLYPMERAHHIPPNYLKRFCLRGTGDYMGQLLIDKTIRQRVRLTSINLIEPFPELGKFDVIFLRNVIIYFDTETKVRVVEAVSQLLKPGGWLVVGHSESLINPPKQLESVLPTIYRKVI